MPSETVPKKRSPSPFDYSASQAAKREFSRRGVRAVIAAAAEAKALAEEKALAEAAAAEAAAAEAEEKAAKKAAKAAALAANGHRKKLKHKKPLTDEEREASKEKRLLKLVGPIVVKCMSKHSDIMDHEVFKKNAKEVRSSHCLRIRI